MANRNVDGLALIFSIFLGLLVATLIGVGVYTFYPPDHEELRDEISDLRQEQVELRNTDQAGAELDANADRLAELEDRRRQAEEDWAKVTSVVVILFATLVMALSILRAGGWPVISNGLLLGGVFSMLYGAGWSVASGDSMLRFWVILFALAVTLLLGWLRFVRRPEDAPVPAGTPAGELAERVARLERKLDALREALGQR